jgi:hypothetical protein
VNTEVGAVHRKQRLAKIANVGLTAGPEFPLRNDDPHGLAVLHPVQTVGTDLVGANTRGGFLGHLDLGDESAPCRVPSWKLDAGGLANDAASAVAPDQIPGAE